MTIEGLPEGVEAIRIGIAGPDDFELTETDGTHQITKGPRAGTSTQIIVQPAKGYAFRFDARAYCYVAVKMLEAPLTITATAKFVVDSNDDVATINEALHRLKELPGFVGLV